MIPRGAIFRRYALIVSAALVGSLVVSGLVEIAFAARENLQRTQEYHVSEARAVSRRVEYFFAEIERNFVAIASSPWTRGLDMSDRMREYQRAMRLLPAIRDVTLAGADGVELLFVSRTEPNRGRTERTVHPLLVESARAGKAFVGKLQHERAGRTPYVQMAFKDGGPQAGVSIATISLQFISDELSRMRRRGKEQAYVLDGEGGLVAHVDVSRPLEQASLSTRAIAEFTADEGSAWQWNEGALALAVWHTLENPRWKVVAIAPWQQALAPVLQTLYRTLGLVAIAILLALAISRFLANRMARPVLLLKAGAEAFGSGDLRHRIELRTGDELEGLANEFNLMADQLQDYTTGLERKVDEKTAQLQAADRHKTDLLQRVEKERLAAEQALQIAQEAMRAKALFLAAASHDLRQPLYAISILADTLAMEPMEPSGAAVLGKQRQAIDILGTMFDNLLDLSRFDAGEIRPVLHVVSLREVLSPFDAEYGVLCHAKGLSWHCEISESWVRTDPMLVRRLVGNLLSNAVRYSISGAVSLSAIAQGAHAVIVVSDTGVGIAGEDQSRIFEEFVQLSNPGRDRDKGVGLGLSIVKRIADLLDANFQLESKPAVGTRVTFELPLADALPNAAEVLASPDRQPSGPHPTRLWVVEDDAVVREALALQLAALGVEFGFAADRAELNALREAETRWPDAVMLDDMLGSGETGLDIAMWLGEHLDAERILIVTGNVDPKRMRELQSSGFQVLRKPVASAEMSRWLARAASLPQSFRSSPAALPSG